MLGAHPIGKYVRYGVHPAELPGLQPALSDGFHEPAAAHPATTLCLRRDLALLDANQQTCMRHGESAAAAPEPAAGEEKALVVTAQDGTLARAPNAPRFVANGPFFG